MSALADLKLAAELTELERVSARTLELLEALIVSLPKCDECGVPATKAYGRGGLRWCDDHAPSHCTDYPRAEPLRAAIAWLAEYSEKTESTER